MNILNKLFLSLTIVSLLFSCNRDELIDPVVEVTTDRQVYAVGDSVEFRFNGGADMITFYSGEAGNEYRYKDRVELEGGELMLNMDTHVLHGSQTDNLRVFMSTDFSGKYTKEGVQAGTWTDITNRLTLSTGTRIVSGDADLGDLVQSGKPVYFGLRYIGRAASTAQQRTWRIYGFNVQNKFSEAEVIPVISRVNAGWTPVTVHDPGNKGVWFLTHADMIYYTAESNLMDVEKWVITKRLDPNKVSPDNGTPIKKYPDSDLQTYTHTFNQAGEYEVTFVFVNGNYKGARELVKTIKVTVE